MNQEKIGLFISELRKEKNLTQKDLGDLLDITDNSVSKWERGINAPDISQLKRIASIFNITVGELLNGERNFKKRENNNGERVLEVKSLSKSFGTNKILNNINFELYSGDVVGLIGPNGCGKTTLMKCILGLYHCDTGKVEIDGNDIRYNLEDALKVVGSVIENPDFYLNISGLKNLKIRMALFDMKDVGYMNAVIHEVKLDDSINKKVKTYSLGMKQRLGIANALINKPKLLILDEPTNGLDPIGIKQLRELLINLSRNSNVGILISSHNLPEIENICDRILMVDHGTIIEDFGIEKVKYKNISLEEEFMNKLEGDKND